MKKLLLLIFAGSFVSPPSIITLDNSAGPMVIAGATGDIDGAAVQCSTLANPCLEFVSPHDLNIRGLKVSYAVPNTVRNGAFTLYITGGTNVLLTDAEVSGGNSACIVIEKSTNVRIRDAYPHGCLGNGLLIANSTHVLINGLLSHDNADGALETTYYDGNAPFACSDVVATGLNSTNDGAGYINGSCGRVALSGFVITNPYGPGIAIRQDHNTTTKVWPDVVSISGGVIAGAGLGQTGNPNQPGVSIVIDAPPAAGVFQHIQLSSVQISGSTGPSISVSGPSVALTQTGVTQ